MSSEDLNAADVSFFFFKKNAELKDEVGIVSTDLDES